MLMLFMTCGILAYHEIRDRTDQSLEQYVGKNVQHLVGVASVILLQQNRCAVTTQEMNVSWVRDIMK